MKRLIAFFLFFLCAASLFSCAADQTEEKIRQSLTPPLEIDCDFKLGEIDGRAHLNLSESALTLGITDGVLAGLVVTTDESSTRFLFEGMDVSFSESTTQLIGGLRKCFAFLRTQDFHPAHAEELGDVLRFSFVDGENSILYSVNKTDCTPNALTLQSGSESFTLTVI